jgi:hypothetical protein
MMGLSLTMPAVTFAGSPVQPARPNNVRFYQEPNCTSPPYVEVPKGTNLPDLKQWTKPNPGGPSWDDQISCIVIGDGIKKVIVYEDAYYGGKTKTFMKTKSNPDGIWSLAGDWWNNKISSVKIE